MAQAGALFSYGPSLAAQSRRSAHLVDRILRGGKPADIPVEAANLLELVVNLQSARALGIRVPESILQRALRRQPPGQGVFLDLRASDRLPFCS